MKKAIIWASGLSAALVMLVIAGYAAFHLSPWPSALMLRRGWDKGGVVTNGALEKYVPSDVTARLDISYDASDSDARLDVYYPSGEEKNGRGLPTVVWIHGGSWISGSKDHVSNYLKILASKGFTTIGVGYTLAPGGMYPTPVRQVNTALGFLRRNAGQLHIDPSRLFLAGDSAGAQIAAQVGVVITAPPYAAEMGIVPSILPSELRGMVLHGGMYDVKLARFGRTGVLWSYFGTKDFMTDPRVYQFSVLNHVTAAFPPTFVSSGNDDALAPQSYALAEKLGRLGVPVDRLFFPEDSPTKVMHGFQFDLGAEAGRTALRRSVEFMTDRLQPVASAQ